jgi:hypothetical protein
MSKPACLHFLIMWLVGARFATPIRVQWRWAAAGHGLGLATSSSVPSHSDRQPAQTWNSGNCARRLGMHMRLLFDRQHNHRSGRSRRLSARSRNPRLAGLLTRLHALSRHQPATGQPRSHHLLDAYPLTTSHAYYLSRCPSGNRLIFRTHLTQKGCRYLGQGMESHVLLWSKELYSASSPSAVNPVSSSLDAGWVDLAF